MNLLLLEPFKTTFPSFRWIWRDNYTFLFEGEERDGIIGIGSEKNLQIYTTRSACCFSRDISDIFFFFFKIKQFAEGVVRKPDSLQNPYELAASFHFLVLAVLSSPICRINTYVIEWIALRRSCVLLASIERRVSTHFFSPPSLLSQSEWDARRCSIVITIIALKNGTWECDVLPFRSRLSLRKLVERNLSNRRVKKVLTNKPAKLRIDSILVSIVCFCPRRVFTSSRIRTSSLADRWPAYLRRARLVWRNETGEVKA